MSAEAMPLWILVKQATAQASADVGGDKVLAAVTDRITHSTRFSEYSSLKYPNRVVPFDAAIEADRYAQGRGLPVRHMQLAATELGLLLVPCPEGRLADSDIAALCKISQESAEAIAAFAAARADGVTTPDEARLVRAAILDAQTAFAELDARMARIIEGGEGAE